MTKVGEHITLDIIGTKKEYDPSFFENLIHKIAKKAKVTILEISKYKFKPQGFTLVALLAESHMSFHTFPENNIISFDFFTCGKISPSVAIDIIKKEIEHKRIVTKELSKNILNALEKRKACLMSNHGQVAFGLNLKQAFELAEEVENICHQYIIALKLGQPKILSSSEMEKILDKVKYYKSV